MQPALSDTGAEGTGADTSSSSQGDASAGTNPSSSTRIVITVGDRRITATLNDSAAAQEFARSLPLSLPASRVGNIEYMMELPTPLTETGPFYRDVRAGDLVYWNPANSMTVIFRPTSPVGELTKLGEVTSDLDASSTFLRL